MAEAQGFHVEEFPTVNGTYTLKAYDATCNLAFSIENTTSADGLSIIIVYDDNGDTVVDRIHDHKNLFSGLVARWLLGQFCHFRTTC